MQLPGRIRQLVQHPLFLPLYLPSLCFAVAQGMLVPILPLYAADFEVSYGIIGLVLAGAGTGSLLADVPAGMLQQRFGNKRMMLLGLGLIGSSFVLLFWNTSVLGAVLLRMMTGFGLALFGVARHTMLAEGVSVGKRGRATAMFAGAFRIGRFLGPAWGGTLAAAFGLRAPFLVAAGMIALALVLVVIFARKAPPRSAAAAHSGHLLGTVRTYYRLLLSGGVGMFLVQMTRNGWQTIIPLYGADVLGLDAQAIGFIFSLLSGLDMLLFIPAGMVMDRFGRKWAIVPSFVFQGLGLVVIPLAGSYEGLLLASVIIGLANGISAGTMMTLGADLSPEAGRGGFLGIWHLIGDAGASAAPLLVGTVADLLTLPLASLVMAGIGWTAAGVFGVFVPETLKRKVEPEPSVVG